MLSQLVRSNVTSAKNLRTKATKYSDTFKANYENSSEDLDKLSEYLKQNITEADNEIEENMETEIISENPDEVVVNFSDIYKEKEEILPFFKSIQAQLKVIYG
mgnify:CR=1 FL=1